MPLSYVENLAFYLFEKKIKRKINKKLPVSKDREILRLLPPFICSIEVKFYPSIFFIHI
jgi:hypothetical protein